MYPSQSEVQPQDWLACQVPGCSKKYKKFLYLDRHLQGSHGLEGDWVMQAVNRERRQEAGGGNALLTQRERECVTPFA